MLNIILEDKSKSLTNISAFFVRSQLHITVCHHDLRKGANQS